MNQEDNYIDKAKEAWMQGKRISQDRPDGVAANATGLASGANLENSSANQATPPSYAGHFAALQQLRARELLSKVEDLKRFVRENIAGDAGNLAQFKFDEGYLWAKQYLAA